MSEVVRQEELPWSVIAQEFVGEDHGGVAISFLLVDAPPGRGPSLHRHPYDEIFIVQEGEATAVVGDEERQVRAGDILVIPAHTPHAFQNSGEAHLRQIDIHASPRFVTEWLAEQDGAGESTGSDDR
jgi:mannose-6-phosphate isomerase-like protein (cupin superfamily)